MIKTCINDCIIDGLIFIQGLEYKIEFNPYCKKIVIYNLHGYTFISKNEFFIIMKNLYEKLI